VSLLFGRRGRRVQIEARYGALAKRLLKMCSRLCRVSAVTKAQVQIEESVVLKDMVNDEVELTQPSTSQIA